MGNTSSITIEVNDQGALQAFKGINAEAAKLGPSLQPVQRISEQTFNNIEAGALRARESAALLGEEFGIKIPRALRGTIAEASLIGPIFSAAFSGLAMFGFIDIAIHAGEQVEKLVEKLWGHEEQAKKTREAQAELNNIVSEGRDRIEKLQEAYGLIGLDGLPRMAKEQENVNEKFDAAQKTVADLTSRLQIMNEQYAKNKSQVGFSLGIESLPTGPVAAVQGLKGAKEAIADLTKQLAQAKVNLADLGEQSRNAGKTFSEAFSKDQADQIENIAKATQDASSKLAEMTRSANKAGLSGEAQIQAEALAQINAVEQIYSKEPTLAADAVAAIAAIQAEASRKRIKLLTDEADKRLRIGDDTNEKELADRHALDEKMRRMEDETLNIERSAAVAIAAPWERANVSIVTSYQERMDKIREMLNTGDLDEEHAARQQAAAWNEAFGQMRDQLASQMQTFFDDITSGNIGKAFKKMFEDMVFQMVATWILGMQGMRAASASAMGNGPGGILGALFGAGSGSGPGGTPTFAGSGNGGGILNLLGGGVSGGSPSVLSGLDNLPVFSGGAGSDVASGSLFGLGLSAGQGAGLPGIVLPSGAKSGGGAVSGAGGLAGLLTNIFPNGLSIGGATLSGSALATLSAGLGLFGENRILKGGVGNALLGIGSDFLSGAGIGFAIAGPFGAGVGALIGTIVGGITAIFGGIFGQHKGDKARIDVMEPLIAQIKTVKDSYDVFQTDFNTGVGELEQLRTGAIAQLKKIGGKQVSGNTTSTNKLVDDAESYLKTTEAERARRAQLSFGPAQFETGGFVGFGLPRAVPSGFQPAMAFGSGGAVPAIVHEGEYVLQRSAVNRIGRGNLDRMNAGGAGGDTHVHVHTSDPQSFAEYLRAGGLKAIASEMRLAQVEGRW